MKKKRNLRIITWISGIIWILSWIGIYLEIFHWHHMTTSLRLNPPPQLPGMPPPKPGNFLITIILLAVIAPFTFLALVIATRVQKKSSES
jgi:hypothetical protein